MIEISKKGGIILFIIYLMLLFSGCEKSTGGNRNDISTPQNIIDDQLKSIMTEKAKDEEDKIQIQIQMLSQEWIVEEALFGNRIVNEPSQNSIGKKFIIDEDINIIFDDVPYELISIDILSTEDLYRKYAFTSSDVREYDNLTVLVLDTNSDDALYKKIHIMISEDLETIYCYIQKNELEIGFYKVMSNTI